MRGQQDWYAARQSKAYWTVIPGHGVGSRSNVQHTVEGSRELGSEFSEFANEVRVGSRQEPPCSGGVPDRTIKTPSGLCNKLGLPSAESGHPQLLASRAGPNWGCFQARSCSQQPAGNLGLPLIAVFPGPACCAPGRLPAQPSTQVESHGYSAIRSSI